MMSMSIQYSIYIYIYILCYTFMYLCIYLCLIYNLQFSKIIRPVKAQTAKFTSTVTNVFVSRYTEREVNAV